MMTHCFYVALMFVSQASGLVSPTMEKAYKVPDFVGDRIGIKPRGQKTPYHVIASNKLRNFKNVKMDLTKLFFEGVDDVTWCQKLYYTDPGQPFNTSFVLDNAFDQEPYLPGIGVQASSIAYPGPAAEFVNGLSDGNMIASQLAFDVIEKETDTPATPFYGDLGPYVKEENLDYWLNLRDRNDFYYTERPKKLNFVILGTLGFTIHGVNYTFEEVRLGQGRQGQYHVSNHWWIGSPDCYRTTKMGALGSLVCGQPPLSITIHSTNLKDRFKVVGTKSRGQGYSLKQGYTHQEPGLRYYFPTTRPPEPWDQHPPPEFDRSEFGIGADLEIYGTQDKTRFRPFGVHDLPHEFIPKLAARDAGTWVTQRTQTFGAIIFIFLFMAGINTVVCNTMRRQQVLDDMRQESDPILAVSLIQYECTASLP